MARGGKRVGAGRKPGSPNKPKLQLVGEDYSAPKRRPARERMAEMRRRVALYVHQQFTHEEIAAVMGLTVEKLCAVFPRELQFGSAFTRAAIVFSLQTAAEQGSVTAARKLEEMASGAPGVPSAQATLGKKEATDRAAAQAVAAGGRFAPPNPPGVGKKKLAETRAINAEDGTAWEDLLKGTLQ